MKHFEFIILLSKSSPRDAVTVLKIASDEQILALLTCLSLRTQVQYPPVTKKELAVVKTIKKRKKAKQFLKKYIKYIVPMVAVVLSKSIQEILDCVCDLI